MVRERFPHGVQVCRPSPFTLDPSVSEPPASSGAGPLTPACDLPVEASHLLFSHRLPFRVASTSPPDPSVCTMACGLSPGVGWGRRCTPRGARASGWPQLLRASCVPTARPGRCCPPSTRSPSTPSIGPGPCPQAMPPPREAAAAPCHPLGEQSSLVSGVASSGLAPQRRARTQAGRSAPGAHGQWGPSTQQALGSLLGSFLPHLWGRASPPPRND